MPRFFFHLRSATRSLLDCEGIVAADADGARREAMLTVQDFVQPSVGGVHPEWEDWSIDARDERGRCIFSMRFADAAELEQVDSPPGSDEQAKAGIVHLDLERAKREFSSLENQTRDLVRRMSSLVHRYRYEANSLYTLMKQAVEARRQSQELLARSRHQTSSAWLNVG
jgi:hypothetical protein